LPRWFLIQSALLHRGRLNLLREHRLAPAFRAEQFPAQSRDRDAVSEFSRRRDGTAGIGSEPSSQRPHNRHARELYPWPSGLGRMDKSFNSTRPLRLPLLWQALNVLSGMFLSDKLFTAR
jgi:hypothetical protein